MIFSFSITCKSRELCNNELSKRLNLMIYDLENVTKYVCRVVFSNFAIELNNNHNVL